MLRKLYYLIYVVSICFTHQSMAQPAGARPSYTSQWGYLYRTANDKMDQLGIYATEAPVYVLDSTKTHYRVQVSNGDIGYIEKQPLQRAMFGKRSPGEPAQYFYRGSQGAQCPHLFVQVAELRVRCAPSTSGKAIRKLRLNEIICVDYIPLYQDGWVYIGDHFHEDPAFIQAKFLGQELTYEGLRKDYLKIKGKDQQQELILAGRLREMAWNETKYLKQGLAFWKESYANAGVKDPKVDIELEMRLANKFSNRPDDSVYMEQLVALNLHFEWKGIQLFDGKISEAQVQQLGLQKVKDISGLQECGWAPQYFYQSPNMIVAFEENQQGKVLGEVHKMSFANGEVFAIGEERIDADYNEVDFVNHFGTLLSVDWTADPHVYHFQNGDAGLFIITFENGKPARFQTMYFC
ncbi:hypothetical protein LZQ00_17650 [Sphingobacterium sp. SRCM116780]|uniref:hypothetical protein n=1 Tax=Sphingobacterium sp. SRCM116780 TaxID=2907623 RepID=UPI001F21CE11|nr:hypothetical protein [Sphingobacterium sp. SRCM116780]UIR56075.1 hypothetical protein LZQ00_17650 [Sphingobacterium sp. SRCM116780]